MSRKGGQLDLRMSCREYLDRNAQRVYHEEEQRLMCLVYRSGLSSSNATDDT